MIDTNITSTIHRPVVLTFALRALLPRGGIAQTPPTNAPAIEVIVSGPGLGAGPVPAAWLKSSAP